MLKEMGKTRRVVHFAGTCVVFFLFFYSTYLCGQDLSSEEIAAVMEAPSMQASVNECMAGKPHPLAFELVLIIDGEGKAGLKSLEPPMDQEVRQCLDGALQGITFRATGKIHEVSYSLKLASDDEVAPQPPPPQSQQTYPSHDPLQAPGYSWEKEYRKARGMVAGGAVMIAVGVSIMTLPLMYGMSQAGACSNADDTEACKDRINRNTTICLGVGLGLGFSLLGGGITMIVLGKRKKRKASLGSYSLFWPRLSLSPTPWADGMLAQLTWRFQFLPPFFFSSDLQDDFTLMKQYPAR